MESEYLYPVLGDRGSPKEWAERGKPQLLDRARDKAREILSGYYPEHVSLGIHEEIQRRFPIKLPLKEIFGPRTRWLKSA